MSHNRQGERKAEFVTSQPSEWRWQHKLPQQRNTSGLVLCSKHTFSVHRTAWYLALAVFLELSYPKGKEGRLIACSDADWGNCRETRRSVTGLLAIFNGFLFL
ncbi:hypothetical protein O181_111860 [Austropuccinia psidii MF-1]|uniref:Uncharacterized protein n=1 Tax=Austropuccinia psidii MF-1 TaxID=1389203 RepID=A0A9Q3JZA5_9BASI|nr:hypothetical protein [Austropuccinia psidii MF-1]